jgi:hypothetical protein
MTDDETNEARLPSPRFGKPAPLMEQSVSALGWLNRASQAVGSPRFLEAAARADFYLDKVSDLASTPGERAVLAGLENGLDKLYAANANARTLLTRGCDEMTVADVAEFVELCEGEKPFPEI